MIKVLPNAPYLERDKDKVKKCSCGSDDITIGGEPLFEWWQHFIQCNKCLKKKTTGSGSRFDDILYEWNKESKQDDK